MKTFIKTVLYSFVILIALLSQLNFAADVSALIADCESCHGKNGVSKDPTVPTIAGYSSFYLAESLLMYKDKARPCPTITYPEGPKKGESTTMCAASASLSEDTAEEIGDYFAEKPFVRPKQEYDPELAKKGEKLHEMHCAKCHEDGGSSPDDDAGILAGQWMPFLKEQLDDYKSGKRPMDEKMKEKMDELSEEDLKALVHYYGSFQ